MDEQSGGRLGETGWEKLGVEKVTLPDLLQSQVCCQLKHKELLEKNINEEQKYSEAVVWTQVNFRMSLMVKFLMQCFISVTGVSTDRNVLFALKVRC